MSTLTFGIYDLYWFYQNWKLIKNRSRPDIVPFGRALFSTLFCYSLFREINRSARTQNLASTFSPGWLTAAWILLTVSHRLPESYWLVSLLSVLPMMRVQKTVNELNTVESPEHPVNDRFSGWNIVGIVIGGILILLAVAGIFLPEPPA